MQFFLVYLLYSFSQKNKLTSLFAAFNTLDVFNLLEICLIDTDMAQNEPQRKETPPGPSPNSPSLLFEYQCRSSKFIRLANRIEKIDSVPRIELNQIETFLPELECSTVNERVFIPRDFAVATNFSWFYRHLSTELGSRAIRQTTAYDKKCNCCAGRRRTN